MTPKLTSAQQDVLRILYRVKDRGVHGRYTCACKDNVAKALARKGYAEPLELNATYTEYAITPLGIEVYEQLTNQPQQ